MEKKCAFVFFFLLAYHFTFSQIKVDEIIKVDDTTYSAEQLIKDILINGQCARVENVVSFTGTSTGNNGIGYFFTHQTSSFPISSGVILSTGNAKNASGHNSVDGEPSLADGSEVDASLNYIWKGDVDLERAIGLATNSTNNASIIEFDFIPTSNFISFKFLMASEEYIDSFPCNFSDSFAFLLKPKGSTAPYKNLAVIPNTTTPISVVNIHNAIEGSCSAKNAQYFDKYNTGANASTSAINFNGQTKVFTAFSNVVPNQEYHIKLVIADFQDAEFDSAVFIEAGSFNIGGSLGEDRTIANENPGCNGTPIVLDATIGEGATYQWLKDNIHIAGATNATYGVTLNGTYSVEVDLAGTCTSTLGPIEIEFTLPPVIFSPPINGFHCETDNNGIDSFDFIENTNLVLGTQDKNKFKVSYHKTQKDADENTNPLASPYTNTAQTETIYLRIADDTQTCFLTSKFTISVEELPIANMPSDFEKCDDDIDGAVQFDLTTKVSEILGTQSATDFAVKFYDTLSAANAAIIGTEITTPINNGTDPQQLFVRVESKANSNCFATTTIDLVVHALPKIKNSVRLQQCDDDTDGLSIFNLTEANQLISSNYLLEDFTYYRSRTDAENEENKIAAPMAYLIPTPLFSTVFATVKSKKGCSSIISEIALVVSATQIPASFNLMYEVCDDSMVDDNNANGIASFNFSDATNKVKALFPSGQQITISYYKNLNDALTEINAIDDLSNHRNTLSPNLQDIYVRVDSDVVNACLGLGKYITLKVKPLPKTNALTPIEKCSLNNVAIFDLDSKAAEIIGSQAEKMLISYHTTLADAQNDANAIASGYQNTSNPQTIYVRAQFDANNNSLKDADECYSTAMTFNLIVNPEPILVAGTLNNCSVDVNTVYDLTKSKTQIIKGENAIQLMFFESEENYNANMPIVLSAEYLSDTLEKTLIVIGTNVKGCFAKTTLTLKTTLYLKINKEVDVIEECETDEDGIDVFDLTIRENQLLNGIDVSVATITYHEKEQDAIAGKNAIGTPKKFENTKANSQTIYIRTTPKNSDCHQIVLLGLVVNSSSSIDLKEEYILCFNENDQPMYPYPLLDSKLNENTFAFEWFLGENPEVINLIQGENTPKIEADRAGTYWLRAINKESRCDVFKSTVVIGSYIPKRIDVQRTSDTFSGNNILEVTVEGQGVYEYRLDDDDFMTSNIFRDVLFGERTITVRDIYGCGSKTEKIIVIDYPKVFTPNGDGTNDNWNIVGVGLLQNVRIYIFDRYGSLMAQVNTDEKGWNGDFKGKPMPSSDYWFKVLFTEEGTDKIFKSHFSLKR